MRLSENEIGMLACPRCRASLESTAESLVCRRCATSYPAQGRMVDLSPWPDSGPGPEWARWRRKLDRLQEWRRATWDGSRRAHGRQGETDRLASSFFEFLQLPEGITVLEIGCGSAGMRRYLTGHRYWGLDPLMEPDPSGGEAVTGAVFLRGVGEHLPLADSVLDAAILCETLDHCLDPASVIREARRVLKPGGILGIMQNVRNAGPRSPVPFHRRLRVHLGRLRSRLRGPGPIDAAETKTRLLGREELIEMVGSHVPIASSEACDQVLFMRAMKHGRSAASAGGGRSA